MQLVNLSDAFWFDGNVGFYTYEMKDDYWRVAQELLQNVQWCDPVGGEKNMDVLSGIRLCFQG